MIKRFDECDRMSQIIVFDNIKPLYKSKSFDT